MWTSIYARASPGRSAASASAPGSPAERPHRLVQGYPVGVDELEERRGEGSGQGTASEVGGLEAESFFVGERDHFNREGEGLVSCAETVDDFDGDQDPERTVVAAGVAHAVEVTTEQKRRHGRL